jgi:hypothetical protein
MFLQIMGELFGNHQRPATRLPGNGHRAANPALRRSPGLATVTELAVDEGQTMFQAGSLNHNRLPSFQTGGAPGSSPTLPIQNTAGATAFNAAKTDLMATNPKN